MAVPDVVYERYWVVACSAEEAARTVWAWSTAGVGQERVFARRWVAEEAADRTERGRVFCFTQHVYPAD